MEKSTRGSLLENPCGQWCEKVRGGLPTLPPSCLPQTHSHGQSEGATHLKDAWFAEPSPCPHPCLITPSQSCFQETTCDWFHV